MSWHGSRVPPWHERDARGLQGLTPHPPLLAPRTPGRMAETACPSRDGRHLTTTTRMVIGIMDYCCAFSAAEQRAAAWKSQRKRASSPGIPCRTKATKCKTVISMPPCSIRADRQAELHSQLVGIVMMIRAAVAVPQFHGASIERGGHPFDLQQWRADGHLQRRRHFLAG